MSEKIVKNTSKGYGYNYASLADMARQGVKIPQMTTKLIDGVEFVYYKDGEQWLQGARVITNFEAKGMNSAQAYGSALTYARRYTVAMANAIATDDDDKIETSAPRQATGAKPTEKQLEFIAKLLKTKKKFDDEAVKNYLQNITTMELASKAIKSLNG